MWAFRTLAILSVLLVPPLESPGDEIVVEGTLHLSFHGLWPSIAVCVVRTDDGEEYTLLDVDGSGSFDISDSVHCLNLVFMDCRSRVRVTGQVGRLESFGMGFYSPQIVFLSPFPACGDVDGSGQIDISDAIRILDHLFSATPASLCPGVSDVNGDGSLDISDAVYLLGSLFLGGPAPQCP